MLWKHIQDDPGTVLDGTKADAKYVWGVTYYKEEPYEGDGDAVLFRADGKYELWNLSHCSCHEAWESRSGFLKDPDVYDTYESLRVAILNTPVAAAVAAMVGDVSATPKKES